MTLFGLECPTNDAAAILEVVDLISVDVQAEGRSYVQALLLRCLTEQLYSTVVHDELLSLVVEQTIGLAAWGYLAAEDSQFHLSSRFALVSNLECLLAHASRNGELGTFLASKCRVSDGLLQLVCLKPAKLYIFGVLIISNEYELYRVRLGITAVHDTRHSVGTIGIGELGACALLSTLAESKLLILSRNSSLRIVATIVEDVRVAVNHSGDVLLGLEVVLEALHEFLHLCVVCLRCYDREANIYDRAVRSTLVLLLLVVIEFLDVSLGNLNQ